MSSAKKIKLDSFDSLFGKIPEVSEEKINTIDLELDLLQEFKNHPFKVLDLEELSESIKQHGVLVPIIVRPCEKDYGFYEIIAGHRRTAASRLAGKNTIPAIVMDVGDAEATLLMVDTNIQRENLLPSEKAFAFKLKMDALRHQGKKGTLSAGEVGEEAGESARQVQRYIRLTYLIPTLLNLIDEKKLNFIAGVHLSYLEKEEQILVCHVMQENKFSITVKQAELLKDHSKQGLTEEKVKLILTKEGPKKKKIKIDSDQIISFFPESYSPEEMEQVIYKLLEQWKREKGETEKKY